jgi:hypothetical protein
MTRESMFSRGTTLYEDEGRSRCGAAHAGRFVRRTDI